MNNEAKLAQLNALVGSALRGLVESGASAEAIGAFASSYRHEAAQIIGIEASPPKTPDLQSLVMEAVSQALAEANVGSRRKTAKPTAQKFYVTVDGKRTSVSINSQTVTRLIDAKCSAPAAREQIQQLANAAPPSVDNRSRWIEERILASLSFTQTITPIGQSRH